MQKFLAATLLGMAITSAQALPYLQLDIGGGTYNNNTESITTSADQFSLYALVNAEGVKYKGLKGYSISAAISPQGTVLGADYGSFTLTINGITTTYSAAANNMVYGTAPVDATDITLYEEMTGVPNRNGDLASHGVFDTSYGQLNFNFSPTNHAVAYNTQDNPGGFTDDPSNTAALIYQEIKVDISGLAAGFGIHFDLFHLDSKNKVDQFAPFSHDAESGGGGGGGHNVPDGGSTLILLSSGLLGLGFLRRKLNKA